MPRSGKRNQRNDWMLTNEELIMRKKMLSSRSPFQFEAINFPRPWHVNGHVTSAVPECSQPYKVPKIFDAAT